MDMSQIQISPTGRVSPGGQQVGGVNSGVCVQHLPTGTSVTFMNERSQVRNKDKALKYLEQILIQEGCLPPQEG